MNCKKPFIAKNQAVPCGACSLCRMDRSKAWTLRMEHESKYHMFSVFVTLTYNDEFLPTDKSLKKRDVQLFLKRLRSLRHKKFRYYLCGEYGEHGARPHYHAILFGIACDERQQIEKCWPQGFVHVGAVESASIAYCTKYIQKKWTGATAPERYQGRTPEFALMSRKPGIGSLHAKDRIEGWLEKGYIIQKGEKRAIPAYYKKLATEDQRQDYRNNVSFQTVHTFELRRQEIGYQAYKEKDQKILDGKQKDLNLRTQLAMKNSKL